MLALLELPVDTGTALLTAGWLKGIALPKVGSAEVEEPKAGCEGLAGDIGSYTTCLGLDFC